MEDQYANFIATLDQMGANMRAVAVFLGNYHHSLVESGLPEGTASDMVKELHSIIMAMFFPKAS